MKRREATKIIDKVLCRHFPHFFRQIVSSKITKWSGKRTEGCMYEGILVQFSSYDPKKVALNFRIVVHYFVECPVPSGVFGAEQNLLYTLDSVTKQNLPFEFWPGSGWIFFNSNSFESDINQLFDSIIKELEYKLSRIAHDYESDPVRKKACEFAQSLKGKNPSHEYIRDFVANLGSPKEMNGFTYPSFKLSNQIEFWLKGSKLWAQI